MLFKLELIFNRVVLHFPIQGPFKFKKTFIDLHKPSEKFRLVVH